MRVFLSVNKRLGIVSYGINKFNANPMPPQPPALYQGCSTSKERIKHDIAGLGKSSNRLVWNLRHEVTVILSSVDPTPTPGTNDPEAIGDNIFVISPILGIDLTDIRPIIRLRWHRKPQSAGFLFFKI